MAAICTSQYSTTGVIKYIICTAISKIKRCTILSHSSLLNTTVNILNMNSYGILKFATWSFSQWAIALASLQPSCVCFSLCVKVTNHKTLIKVKILIFCMWSNQYIPNLSRVILYFFLSKTGFCNNNADILLLLKDSNCFKNLNYSAYQPITHIAIGMKFAFFSWHNV